MIAEEDRLRLGMRARSNDKFSGSVGRSTNHDGAAVDDPRGDTAEDGPSRLRDRVYPAIECGVRLHGRR
ncbi:unnamed protein product [Linum trigynum]|uniref:Uncharacterized protein n=1 Tax=Linum trigynum TaxID=586398 RepID=A0AAV2CBG0_9ROSI